MHMLARKIFLIKIYFFERCKMILKSSIKKKVPLFFLILLLGVVPTFSEKENSNYYLGVLAKGYPPSLVANEFKFANARVVNIKDNMVLSDPFFTVTLSPIT